MRTNLLIHICELKGSYYRIAGAAFSSQLVKKLDGLGNIPQSVVDAVRTSVEAIFALPPETKEPVIRAYMSAVDFVFIIGIPAAALAAVAGMAVARKKIDVSGM